MTITETRLTTVESKKAVESKILNGEILPSTTKRANFDQVAAGVCPHCECPLGEAIATSGAGAKRTCVECGHTWYINKRIRTCKCLTCSGTARKSSEPLGSREIAQYSEKKNGGA